MFLMGPQGKRTYEGGQPAAEQECKRKRRCSKEQRRLCMSISDSTGDFAGTQTPGTNIYMAGGTIDDCLHALDIGLPCAVGPSVGVGHLDPEGNTLVTELTLCHPLHLLAVRNLWA